MDFILRRPLFGMHCYLLIPALLLTFASARPPVPILASHWLYDIRTIERRGANESNDAGRNRARQPPHNTVGGGVHHDAHGEGRGGARTTAARVVLLHLTYNQPLYATNVTLRKRGATNSDTKLNDRARPPLPLGDVDQTGLLRLECEGSNGTAAVSVRLVPLSVAMGRGRRRSARGWRRGGGGRPRRQRSLVMRTRRQGQRRRREVGSAFSLSGASSRRWRRSGIW